MSPGKWIEKISSSVGKHFELMTTDGVSRSGKITKVVCDVFIFNDKEVKMPVEIEINGDPMDKVPLSRLTKLNIY